MLKKIVIIMMMLLSIIIDARSFKSRSSGSRRSFSSKSSSSSSIFFKSRSSESSNFGSKIKSSPRIFTNTTKNTSETKSEKTREIDSTKTSNKTENMKNKSYDIGRGIRNYLIMDSILDYSSHKNKEEITFENKKEEEKIKNDFYEKLIKKQMENKDVTTPEGEKKLITWLEIINEIESREELKVIFLDSKNRIVKLEKIDNSISKTIAEKASTYNSKKVILIESIPEGIVTSNIIITKEKALKMKKEIEKLNLELNDYILIGKRNGISLIKNF